MPQNLLNKARINKQISKLLPFFLFASLTLSVYVLHMIKWDPSEDLSVMKWKDLEGSGRRPVDVLSHYSPHVTQKNYEEPGSGLSESQAIINFI
jgi:hypothetical protein